LTEDAKDISTCSTEEKTSPFIEFNTKMMKVTKLDTTSIDPKIIDFIQKATNSETWNKGYLLIPVDVSEDRVIRPNFDFPVMFKEHQENDHSTQMTSVDESPVKNYSHIYQLQNMGKYSRKERAERIRKYKEKIMKWRCGMNRNKDLYSKRRTLAKFKPRVKGRFVSQTNCSSNTENS
jgi:hypothetical protein